MTSPFVKGPWTISQYGPAYVDDGSTHGKWVYNGERFTIKEIMMDVHTCYDGGGRKEQYPDGVIMNGQDVREVVALLLTAPRLRDALQALLAAPNDLDARAAARIAITLATTPVDVQDGVDS